MWFLSFDCATKTFAFALIRAEFSNDYIDMKNQQLIEFINEKDYLKIINLNKELNKCFELVDGDAIDLAPGRKDKTINTVERIKLTSNYINCRIKKSLEENECNQDNLKILVEFQMGANSASRVVSDCIVSQFYEYDVELVKPAYKNQINLPGLEYCYFMEKYSSTYSANKNHSKATYAKIAKIFNHKCPQIPKKMMDDFADCVMQVLGYIRYSECEL